MTRISPEKVIPAEEFPLAAEALVGEVVVAVHTADTLGVPRPVENIQKEFVQDWLVTAGTGDDHGVGGRRGPWRSACNTPVVGTNAKLTFKAPKILS